MDSERETFGRTTNSSTGTIANEPSTSRVELGYKNMVENPYEMKQKLEDLQRENLELKKSLEQSNLEMEQHLSALVKKQEELGKVYEAHRTKYANSTNLVEVLKAENEELKARIEDYVKDCRHASTQTEELDEDTVIAPVKNDLSTELIAMTEKCQNQIQEIAHSHRIIESLKEQLESLFKNSFATMKLEDLPSTIQNQKEPFRKQFLENFAHYNEKLRALGYCYAAQTSRYTTVQDYLQRCNEILLLKKHCPAAIDDSDDCPESEKPKDLDDYRSMLIDEESKTIAEREAMIRAQNEFQKIFIDYNSMILETESLRQENVRLNNDLQSARNLRDDSLKKAEAALKEKERLMEEQSKVNVKDRQDLLARKKEVEESLKASAKTWQQKESSLNIQIRNLTGSNKDLSEKIEELEEQLRNARLTSNRYSYGATSNSYDYDGGRCHCPRCCDCQR